MKILFLDTETDNLPKNYQASYEHISNWPRMVELAIVQTDEKGRVIKQASVLVKPQVIQMAQPRYEEDEPAYDIIEPYFLGEHVIKIHGITNEMAHSEGHDLKRVLQAFDKAASESDLVVCHNVNFDQKVIFAEMYRLQEHMMINKCGLYPWFCTMELSRKLWGKWESLSKLHELMTGEGFTGAHRAKQDTEALVRCFFKMVECGYINLKSYAK